MIGLGTDARHPSAVNFRGDPTRKEIGDPNDYSVGAVWASIGQKLLLPDVVRGR